MKKLRKDIEKFLLSYSKDIKELFESELKKIEEIKKALKDEE